MAQFSTQKLDTHKLSGRTGGQDDPLLQAAFDFMPSEMRERQRFGGAEAATQADYRTQSKLVDRQVAGLVSRIAAARLRQVLSPANTDRRAETGAAGPSTPVVDPTPETVLEAPTMFPQQRLSSLGQLEQQRSTLRDAGAALFYFRGDDAAQLPVQMQRLHPRPLPARYYDATLLPQEPHAQAA